MKKCLRTGKKALSVFMAVLMALTAMVFAAPQKASATNGEYTVKYYIQVNDAWTNNKDEFKFHLGYKVNNGRGYETELSKTLSGTDVSFKNKGNVTVWQGTLSGFPTYIYEECDMWTPGGAFGKRIFKYVSYVQVWNGSSWVEVITSDERFHESPYPGHAWRTSSKATPVAASFPYVPQTNTISATTAVQDIGIPPLGDNKDVSTSVTAPQYYSYDQYGVRYEPTSYSVTGVEGLNTSGGGGNPYNITATTATTQSKTDIVQNATLTANWVNPYSNQAQHGETTATFKVYNPRYRTTYNGNSGVLGTQATYTYGNQTISSETSDTITNNHETLTAEKFPTDGLRAGYTFNGIWSLPSGGIKRGANAVISADETWYAQWIANKYNAIFKATKGTYPSTPYEYTIATTPTDCDSVPVPPSEVEDYDEGDYHYTYNRTWKNSLGNVYEANNLPAMTMNEEGVVYWAQYDREFVEADYSEVEKQTALAYKDYINEENYESLYEEASRNRLEAAIKAVVTGLGRTRQEIVDAYAEEIKDAIEAMGREKYSVVFVDSLDNTVIRFDYPVYYGYSIGNSDNDDIKYPTNTDKEPNRTYHYKFTGWSLKDKDNSTDSVTANLVINANYERSKHTFETEEFGSTCTSAKGTKYTCTECGYSYNVYEGGVGDEHVYSTEWTIDVEPTCTTDGIKSHHCTRCGFRTDETKIDKLGHDFDGVKPEVIVAASCENDGASIMECNRCGFNEYTIEPKLEHEFEKTVVEATCTSKGYTVSECKKCGTTLIGSYVDALGHKFKEVTDENIEASCIGVGYTVYQCETCGLKQYNTIEPRGHAWNEEATIDLEATCLKDGQKSIHCATCGAIKEGSVETIPATKHNLDDGEVLVAQWCNQQGVMIYRCQNEGCGYAETSVSDALEHDMEVTTTPATCTDDGSKISVCKRCSETVTEVIGKLGHDYAVDHHVDPDCTTSGYDVMVCKNDAAHTYNRYDGTSAKGHDWNEWQVVTASTNDNAGLMKRTCKNCDATEEVEIPKGGHRFDTAKGTEIKAATCKVGGEGEMEYACVEHVDADGNNTCGVKITVEIARIPHELTTDVKNATCEEDGYIKTYCKICGEVVYSTVLASPKQHTWGDWQTKVEETCGKPGIRIRFCKVCGASEEAEIPATGKHNYAKTVVPPTCTQQGYTIFACMGCGVTYRDFFVAPLGHDMKDDWVDVAETCTTPGGRQRACHRTWEDERGVTHKCDYVEFEEDPARPATGHSFSEWKFVTHPSVKDAYAKWRQCMNTGCTHTEYEKGEKGSESVATKDGVNIYYQVNYYNEWATDTYDVLTGNLVSTSPTKTYTKLAKTYKTVKLATIYVLKGQAAVYPNKLSPVREKDADWGEYVFEGWTEKGQKALDKDASVEPANLLDLSKISENTDVYALFRCKDRYYRVVFYNANGSMLTIAEHILHGHSAEWPAEFGTPTLPENNEHMYKFKGWSYDFSKIYDDVAIIAQYDSIMKSYVVVYHDWNGKELGRETIAYGDPAVNIPAVAERPEDNTYVYQFLNKWALANGEEVNLESFTAVPDGAKDGDEVHVYAKHSQRLKVYKVNLRVWDPFGMTCGGATVQVINSQGRLVASTTTDVDGYAYLSLNYSTAYSVKISRGNYALEGTMTLDTSAPGSIPLTYDITQNLYRNYNVSLIDYTNSDDKPEEKCNCICHSFIGGLWITVLNLIYRLFKVKQVCCYDMYVVHGDKLVYGPN